MSRQAGILLPLFSLRSGSDWGVGEIPDLLPWARWCAAAGFSVAQVLPVNEASRGQSSPYGALSAFAIDPVYASLEALPDFAAAGVVAVPRRVVPAGILRARADRAHERAGGGVD